jgi:hypothetical protein
MNKTVIYYLFISLCLSVPISLKSQTAKWTIKPQYTSIAPFGNEMYKVKSGSSVGILDKEGKVVVPLFADSITGMTENCALVLQYEDTKYRLKGILHSDKKMIPINDEWYINDYPFFSEGKLPVLNKNGNYGYINTFGNLILEFNYSSIHPFSEGWAAVCKGESLIGKGIGFIKRNISKNSKEKVFYIDEQGRVMSIQSDIGDIFMGTSFKNGEALVIPKNNKYCIINKSGKLVRIDNGVALVFDEKYALQKGNNVTAVTNNSLMVFDGPTAYTENNKYGYKQGSKIVIPAQFKEASPFSKGFAIASIGNYYGLLKLVQGDVKCNQVPGTLKTTDNKSESVDFIISIPEDLKDCPFNLQCLNSDSTKSNCSSPGDNKTNRTFSFILPKGKRELSLFCDNLKVWDSAMSQAPVEENSGEKDNLDISILTSSAKANAKDNAAVTIMIKNNAPSVIELTVNISGEQMKTIHQKVKLDSEKSKKFFAYFTNIRKEEYRTVTVSTSLSNNSISKRIKLLPFFVKY